MDISALLNNIQQPSAEAIQAACDAVWAEDAPVESVAVVQEQAAPSQTTAAPVVATYVDWLKAVLPADDNDHWKLHLKSAALQIRKIIGAWNALYISQQIPEQADAAIAQMMQICPVTCAVLMETSALPQSLLAAHYRTGKPANSAPYKPVAGLLPYKLGTMPWLSLPRQALLAATEQQLQALQAQFDMQKEVIECQEIITGIHHPLACKYGIYCSIASTANGIPVEITLHVCTYGEMASYARSHNNDTILEFGVRVYSILKAQQQGTELNIPTDDVWLPFVLRAPRSDKGMPRRLRF